MQTDALFSFKFLSLEYPRLVSHWTGRRALVCVWQVLMLQNYCCLSINSRRQVFTPGVLCRCPVRPSQASLSGALAASIFILSLSETTHTSCCSSLPLPFTWDLPGTGEHWTIQILRDCCSRAGTVGAGKIQFQELPGSG